MHNYKYSKQSIEILFFLSVAIIYLLIIKNSSIINDDYMALYSSWLLSEGKVEEYDYHIDSYSILFDLMSFILSPSSAGFYSIYLYRILFFLVLLSALYRTYKILSFVFSSLYAKQTIFLLCICSAIYYRVFDLRPDLIILLLWLEILYYLFIPKKQTPIHLMYIGACISFSLLLKFKSIIILCIIPFYIAGLLLKGKHYRETIKATLVIASGSILQIVIFSIFIGKEKIYLWLIYSLNLLKYSSEKIGSNTTLKINVLSKYTNLDFFWFFLFAIGSIYILKKIISSYSINKNQIILSFYLISILSVLLNPHYHSYNLVTLYFLMSIGVCSSIELITELIKNQNKTKKQKNKKTILIAIIILMISQKLYSITSYSIKNKNSHQKALYDFIIKNTNKNDMVFSLEGMGLYRKSPYHWRSSFIMIEKYHSNSKRILSEITKNPPKIIIKSYRVPSWLSKIEKEFIIENYITISKLILVPGIKFEKSESNKKIIIEGKYKLNAPKEEICKINKKEIYKEEVIHIKKGQHKLYSKLGKCQLIWNIPTEEIKKLKTSNARSLPYLISPK